MEFTLRNLQPEDFDTLWSIDQRCFAPGIAYSRRELAIYIRRRGAFTLVAEKTPPARMTSGAAVRANRHELSGIVGFIVAEARRGVGHIISIDVLPENRRFGLGSKLLAAAEERLQHLCCSAVVLETAVDNTSALAFYKRHQYSVMKVVPRYYSNDVDALVLGKNLSSEPEMLEQQG